MLVCAECRQEPVCRYRYGHVVVDKPHGGKFAVGYLGVCVAVDDAVLIDGAYGPDDLVALRGSDVETGGGVEACRVVGDYGLLQGEVTFEYRFESGVYAVLEVRRAHRVEMLGDVERCREEGIAPWAVHLIDEPVLVGAWQEIDYQGDRGQEQGHAEHDVTGRGAGHRFR